MREWCDALLALLLAPACAACGELLLHPTRGCVCQRCWQAIATTPLPVCDRCGGLLPLAAADGRATNGAPVCGECARADDPNGRTGVRQWDRAIGSGPVVERARAIGPHAGSLRAVIHALKYDGRRSVARPLAQLMSAAGADLVRRTDVAVPVPLHPARRRSRGFNQAADLARHIGLPVVHALVRTRNTETQTALPAAERHANVAGAFRPTRRAAALGGACVLLVDDVRTTGATLDACGAALKDAGARCVTALTAARVEMPGS
jgi:ComF family protein